MKHLLILTLVAAAQVAALPAEAQYAQYVLSWQGTGYTPDSAGNIRKIRVTDKDLIQVVAADNGLDPKQLALVYRVDARDTAVVWKKDGAFVADVMQVQYLYVDVANAKDTMTVRQAMLYDEAHDMTPIGSVFGTEKASRDANGNLRSYSFKGSFQYGIPETQTVYTGTFGTGKALNDTTRGG